MNKTMVLLLAGLFVSPAGLASPKVVSDPVTNTQITHCAWYLDSNPRELVAAPRDNAGNPYCLLNVANVSNGQHTVQAAFVIQDSLWGNQEGPKSDPFVFERPSAPESVPTGIILVP